jgi:hypothetical protein
MAQMSFCPLMRTDSVRVESNDAPMTQPILSEALMRDREHRVAIATEHAWQLHQPRRARGAALRTGMGRLLVRAGLRLARLDPTHPLGDLIAG